MIEYWHNPRCSKSRAGLALLEEHGAQVEVRKYLEDVPTADELRAVLTQLGVAAIDMMRTGEKQFKELGLTKVTPEDDLIRAMAEKSDPDRASSGYCRRQSSHRAPTRKPIGFALDDLRLKPGIAPPIVTPRAMFKTISAAHRP